MLCLPNILIAKIKLFEIGKFKLRGDIQNSINSKLEFFLHIKLIDENICSQIKNTENLLFERISQYIKNKKNYQYESSSDEEDDEENKKKLNEKSDKKSEKKSN